MKEMIADKIKEIEAIIYDFLPKEEGFQRNVFEAMNYSVKVGGKRLRPMLMYETYKLFGGNSNVIKPFMAAIEMIHTYSLVHDDLPAMDNDLLRRGKPTTHAVYGEAMAILAGDGLLNFAFETAYKAFDDKDVDISVVVKAIRILASKAGIYGMIGGQVVDVESENAGLISKEKLDFIFKLKTGALIEASMLIGAVLAGADEAQLNIIESVAQNIGIAFQIQDDVLDVIGDETILGKPIGSDERNQKSTYVVFEGLEKSKADVKFLTDEAINKLQQLEFRNGFLEFLLTDLVYREK